MLMTNMTFTRGVGTPVYMAPEVLQQVHYKMPYDIYSFGITLFECMKWGDAYPHDDDRFRFSWNIAQFVMNGHRMEKPKEMKDAIYKLICQCWCQEPQERLTIDQIITELKRLLKEMTN